jgi:hypothetical protein
MKNMQDFKSFMIAPEWMEPQPDDARRDTMGDKGGKKDKEKGQKQSTEKQKKATKDKLDKQPKRKP